MGTRINKGDTVMLIPEYKNYSSDLEALLGQELIVDRYIQRNLNDLTAEIIYFKGNSSPFLAKHFQVIEKDV